MNKFISIIIILISISAAGQIPSQCGIDDKPILNQIESKFLNEYMNENQRKGFDFTDKKVLFVTGNRGKRIGTKSEYFNNIKQWDKGDEKIATWVMILNEKEKNDAGGYDAIVTFWVKYFPKKGIRKVVKKLKASG